ncbi:MAG: PucR family transcriptional regulator [Elainellaceae cyanobacterium]
MHTVSPSPAQSTSSQIARAIAHRVSDLLDVPVWVRGQQNKVVASSRAEAVCSSALSVGASVAQCLRIPLNLDNHLGEVVVSQPQGESISPRLTKALVELVISQVTSLNQTAQRRSLAHEFIADLLHNRIPDEDTILRQAKFLTLNLTPPRAVILIDTASSFRPEVTLSTDVIDLYQYRHTRTIIDSIVGFFHLPDDTICADLGNGQIVVLKASNSKNLEHWTLEGPSQPASASWSDITALTRAGDGLLQRLRADTGAAISIGIGRYHPGLTGLAHSYEDARVALSLGRRLSGPNQVYCLDRLGIAAFTCIADEQTKVELATHLLSPLDSDCDLLKVLTVFFEEDCCPSSTAKRLSIHRNTLSYRLDKISSLTGLNPRRFDDAVQIRLALLLRALTQPHDE